ncbi:excinuclease ABC subunit UvrA [Halochromatium glycolicum]|uniref:excinuclease ABC subunit UvrA n=1 Tax=Halochromatium glycolicum TaxID=85075 RepID=UPI001F5B10D6|nr:excinuclease ABC subunit UvrA [Halochromatium glycolicum]
MLHLRGVRQNNLKQLDLDLPLGELIVVTGVSGSGKSSLAFDTLYAEGQRRYVETFSPYARQFLDRMDRPQAERIDGIPPAIAIDQSNSIRTSRSTVGTLTELNDHLKLLFARAARLFCHGCGREVQRETPERIWATLRQRAGDEPVRILICFELAVPEGLSTEQLKTLLAQQGYIRFLHEDAGRLEVIQDRLRLAEDNRGRALEGLEAAFEHGRGRLRVYPLDAERQPGPPWSFSRALHCADCEIDYREPLPSLFSFNSPVGACETCRGFGRVIGIDWDQVVPDASKSLLDGAIKPIQSDSYSQVQEDLIASAHRRGVPTDVPWRALGETDREWVLEGEGAWEDDPKRRVWYGIRGFFDWLEGRSYKMHVRVLLSRYRSYDPCPACGGARLKDAALDFRLGDHALADAVLDRRERFRHARASLPEQAWLGLPGLTIHDLMRLPLAAVERFFDALRLPGTLDQAMELLLVNIRSRLRYLNAVGLGYLTLDRQSRTLSGGEVQRVNLTTALGTALVNTLFVLDEPSIGLHPRDMARIIAVLQRLRGAGNSLVVVEHDPQVMRAADRILDIGPGPGEHGGELVFNGPPSALFDDPDSLTGAYLSGRRQVTEPRPPNPPAADEPAVQIRGARAQNLKGIDLALPLRRLVVVTGVSGSGKSTLVKAVLFHHLAKQKGHPEGPLGDCDAVEGEELIADVVMVDQAPIGRSARSNPASYVGALDPLRKLFASAPLARERGYKPGHFSFNSGPGRCPTCSGSGFEHIEMQFLSDVYLRCPDCNGRRYRPEVLEVRLPGEWLASTTATSSPEVGRIADGPELEATPSTEPISKSKPDNRRSQPEVPSNDAQSDSPPISHTASDIDSDSAPNIAEVLAMTVSEALAVFADQPEIQRSLQPLADVGLDYLRLGQPVPTLSGGEAQRLKLAGHLAKTLGRKRRKATQPGLLFLFDEPTTGLHFADIATLLQAFERLLEAGHSLLVIEHNTDLMRAADWLIDLGPEGGDQGGMLVACGTPQELAEHPHSHTGRALSERVDQPDAEVAEPALPYSQNTIIVRHAREHNLKDLSLALPRDRFVVITGVSGSGKSTLAFDILFAEGQRRYLESLNAYARQFVQPAARADVDAVLGLPPTVAIEQRTSRGGHKSTVGTSTEIHHFLRLLFVKLGVQHCPGCQVPIQPQGRQAILERLLETFAGREVMLLAPLVIARKGIYRELAAWAERRRVPELYVDGAFVPVSPWPPLDRYREHSIDLPLPRQRIGPEPTDPSNRAAVAACLDEALVLGKGVVRVLDCTQSSHAKSASSPAASPPLHTYSTQRTCPSCGTGFDEPDPRLFSYNSKHGWCPACFGTGLKLKGFDADQTGEEGRWLDAEAQAPCPACAGQRLRPEALAVRFRGHSIADLSALSVADAAVFFDDLDLDEREAAIATDLVGEIHSRLGFLRELGLGYLKLERAAPTLSGGEAQRIRLAAQLGSNLRGVCYILDEPSIGLHARDHARLLDSLAALKANGNSLIVVEHDAATMRHADEIIDLGPGAGVHGGEVVARGDAATLAANPASLTGRYLARQCVGEPQAESPQSAPASETASETGRYADHSSQVKQSRPASIGPDTEPEARPGLERKARTSAAAQAEAGSQSELQSEAQSEPETQETSYSAGTDQIQAHSLPARRDTTDTTQEQSLRIEGANLHNLKGLDLAVPLGQFVCVTGVSGSGKSTLVRDVLGASLKRLLSSPDGSGRGFKQRAAADAGSGRRSGRRPQPGALVGCTDLTGWQALTRVLEVDQTPIGKTPRSCPATYIGIWDRIRRLFAAAPEARMLGWGPGRFSFNTGAGRCPACEGQGVERVEMSFLPDVKLPCELCAGTRFNAETRRIRYLGRDIGEVLAMSVDEAVELFQAHPPIRHPLGLLQQVGLGYLSLGQASPTLSGGEAQRIKLVTELAKARGGTDGGTQQPTLYLLDEPTVGLHMADTERLIGVLRQLVQAGHSLIVIEHDLDLIAAADWVIDLGPEGGDAGGRLVADGAPSEIAQRGIGATAEALSMHWTN